MTVYVVSEKNLAKVIGVFSKYQDALKLQKDRIAYWKKYIANARVSHAENEETIDDGEPVWPSLEIQKFEIEEECEKVYVINEMVDYEDFKTRIVNVCSDKNKAINLANSKVTYWYNLAICNDEKPKIRGENSNYQIVSADTLWVYIGITEEKVK